MTTAVLDPNSLSEHDARVIAARDGSMSSFAYAVHRREVEPYQEAWWRALDTLNRVVIVCPPDTFKSTTVQYWVERSIGRDHSKRILWLMRAGDQAEVRVMDVAETIEQNRVYQEAFKVRRHPKKKWTNTMLFVDKGGSDGSEDPDPTLMGCGLNGPYQGLHFDTIVIDDPTNQEDVRSPTTMEAQRAKIRGVILDRLVEAGRIVVILTRWGENDLVPTFAEMGFSIIEMPVIGEYPWGPTISNKRFPMARCEELRRDKTDAIFNLTYMCNPGGLAGGIIRHIKHWDRSNLPGRSTVTLMAADLASSTKTWADPSCIGTAILDLKTKALYVTDLWTGRVEILELEAELKKRAERQSRLVAIGVETVGFQATFLQRLRRERKWPVREIPYRTEKRSTKKAISVGKDKVDRAIIIEQRFLQNKLFLSPQMSMFDGVSVEDELQAFPFGKHDDRLDVIAFLCLLADAYSPPLRRVVLKAGR